mmetsp:Transcript_26874/g.45983  ORF Transcript_26874/g.45983 Transcript_26874/m.45983 type:complete len:239 (-) Transcript_26874:246-962(-)
MSASPNRSPEPIKFPRDSPRSRNSPDLDRDLEREPLDDRYMGGHSNSRSVSLSTVYCGNLPPSMTEEDLEDKLKQFGNVVSCSIPRDPHTRQGRGFGFVSFDNEESADNAAREFNEDGIRIERSYRDKPRDSTPGKYLGRDRGGRDYGRRDRGPYDRSYDRYDRYDRNYDRRYRDDRYERRPYDRPYGGGGGGRYERNYPPRGGYEMDYPRSNRYERSDRGYYPPYGSSERRSPRSHP